MRIFRSGNDDLVGIDLVPSEYTTHSGSIVNREFVKKCMKDVDFVIHTATLHKPHVATHSYQNFVDTNLTGTLNLLEESISQGVKGFIFTSTTSTFGDVLNPKMDEPAVWITEEVKPIPRNIYGVTKTAAEDLCQLFYRNHRLPCLILKTSRFFPEEDDKIEIRQRYEDANSKANEFLYRRVDIEDAVAAHILAIEKATEIGFGKYIISATSPFTHADLVDLRRNAPSVVERIYPDFKELYEVKNWKMFPEIDRVYINEKARIELGWKPRYGFRHVLDCLKQGKDFRSSLSIEIGIKRYHSKQFEKGPYPVNK